MKVFDISAWQEELNWGGLKEEGFEGVIIKIGERSYLDEMFVDHVNNAVAYGFKYGIYYYGHACTNEEARDEAIIVDNWVKTYLRGETPVLGIWYDVEDEDMSGDNVTECCMAFINTLKNYSYVGIYSSWNWLSQEGAGIIDMEYLPINTPYWVAQYNSCNDLATERPYHNIKCWQYTDGYSDEFPYDANVYYE